MRFPKGKSIFGGSDFSKFSRLPPPFGGEISDISLPHPSRMGGGKTDISPPDTYSLGGRSAPYAKLRFRVFLSLTILTVFDKVQGKRWDSPPRCCKAPPEGRVQDPSLLWFERPQDSLFHEEFVSYTVFLVRWELIEFLGLDLRTTYEIRENTFYGSNLKSSFGFARESES